MRTVYVVVAGHEEELVRPQAQRLQHRIEQLLAGGAEFLGLAMEGGVAAEDHEIDLGQCGMDFGALAQVVDQGVAHDLAVEIGTLLVPVGEVEPGEAVSGKRRDYRRRGRGLRPGGGKVGRLPAILCGGLRRCGGRLL
jgi:hypothetical protein